MILSIFDNKEHNKVKKFLTRNFDLDNLIVSKKFITFPKL